MNNPFILNTLFQPKNISLLEEELGSDNTDFKKAKLMESEFSDLVDVMRQYKYLPIPSINTVMTLLYRIVGNRIAPVAINPGVKSLHFWCELHKDRSIAVIMIPENWHDMLVQDAHMQMGALVFAASQAKDYWNNKFSPTSKLEILQRAHSFEAELLHYFSRSAPNFKANDYQLTIMERYPEGIASNDTHYEGRDYDGVFPPFPVESFK